MANFSPAYFPVFRAFDANGNPLAGGKLYSYAAGTTTPLATYTDATGGTPNTNPVELDANGEANVWLGPDAYKFVLQDATGAALWTADGIKSLDELAQAYADTLRTDLANTADPAKGDALMGVQQPFTGASPRTQHDKNQEWVTPEDFGAKGDGTSDDATALQNWASCGVKNKLLPGKTYKTSSTITFEDGSMVSGCGESSVIDGAGGTGFDTVGAVVTATAGALTALPALSVNVTEGDILYTFASDHGLANNDVFLIYNPTDSSWSSHLTVYRAGEFVKVHQVPATNTVIPWNPAFDNYATGDVDLYKLNGTRVYFENFRVKGPENNTIAGIILDKTSGVRIRNVRADRVDYAGIVLLRSYDFQIEGDTSEVNITGTGGSVGLQYGVIVGNSQCGHIQGNFYATRCPVSFGGDDGIGSVPCRDIAVRGAKLHANVGGTGSNTHANCEFITWENCTIYNGVDIGGKNITLRGCRIFGTDLGSGVCAYGGEVVGGYFRIIDCEMITTGNPWGSGNRGIVDFGAGALSAHTKTTVDLIVENCTIKAPNQTGAYVNVYNFGLPSANGKANVKIDNLEVLGAASATAILRYNTNSPTTAADADYVQVTGIRAATAPGCLLVNNVTAMASTPFRLQSQAGAVDVTTSTSAAYAVPAQQTFKWAYPRIPVMQVSRSNSPASISNGLIGNRMGVPYIDRANTTYIQPGIYTDDGTNFSVANTVTLHWTATIEDF